MSLSLNAAVPNYGHLKQRYTFRKVCRIFGITEQKLREWMREGVMLRNGERLRIHYIPIGPRKIEFECDEVERIYQALRSSSISEEGEVLDFPERLARAS